MSGTSTPPDGPNQGSGSTLKPYLRRKKSSLGETKIAVLGTTGVGKSALCVRFLTKRFIGEYDQSIENKYKCTTVLEGESMAFELLDTRSNTPDLDSITWPWRGAHTLPSVCPGIFSWNEDLGAREDVVRWADGFLLVYSVTSRETFDVLADARRRVEELKKVTHVPVILVGNKADLAHVRQVSYDEGVRLAADLSCSFMEVSASEDVTKVTDAFHTLCREIIEFKRRSRTFLDRVFGLKKS